MHMREGQILDEHIAALAVGTGDPYFFLSLPIR